MRIRAALVFVTLGILMAVGLTPSAVADDPPVRTITLSAAERVRVALPTTLTALTSDGTSPLEGQSVRFEKRTPSGTWQALATTTSDATGVATHAVPTPFGAATYRAVLIATDTQPEVVSGERAVTGFRAESQVFVSAIHWYVVDETSRVVNVRVLSEGVPIRGRVLLQQRVGVQGSWRAVGTRLANASGTASFAVRPRVDTYYRAVVGTGEWWTLRRSAVHWLDNRPPTSPVAYPARAPRPRALAANARATGAGAHAVISRIPNGVWRSMVGRSWHRGCPVGRGDLRLIRINYWGYDGYRYRGEMVVRASIARKTVGALKDMYAGRYPIRRMHRVDRFGWSKRLGGANDYASMAAGNTSAFNCRGVVGNPRVRSPHSYGRAVDINPWENPYLSRQGLVPNSWWHYRSHPKVAWRSASHPVMKIWRKNGFRWTYGNSDAHHYDGRMPAPHWGTMVG